MEDSWVWMDYISISQTTGVKQTEEVLLSPEAKVLSQRLVQARLKIALAEQARAIRSIPAYVGRVTNFWVSALT